MKRLFSVVRHSGIGAFVAAILAFVQGCTQNEIDFLFIVFLILTLFGAGGEQNGGSQGAPSVVLLSEITMYNAGTGQGNWGGRAGADAVCRLSGNRPAGHVDDNVRAFLSVSATDEIRDMPGNYNVPTHLPIAGPTGLVISTDWAGLFDNSLDLSYVAANIQPAITNVWSGSTAQGAEIAGSTCQGWISNGNDGGAVGTSNSAVGGGFLLQGTLLCQGHATLLCLAF